MFPYSAGCFQIPAGETTFGSRRLGPLSETSAKFTARGQLSELLKQAAQHQKTRKKGRENKRGCNSLFQIE